MYTRRGAQWRRVSGKGCTVEIEVGVASVAQARVNDLVYQSLQNLLIHLVCDAMAYRDRSGSGRAGAGLPTVGQPSPTFGQSHGCLEHVQQP
jgi:hypothetical protein